MQHSENNTTAILVFALSSQEETRFKRIPKSLELFDHLTRQTLSIVESTKLPYFHITEADQIGNTFGERFTEAIAQVFNKGFDTIITIGNDTPHLKSSTIIEANSRVQNGQSVLGPSVDGGFYLMGLRRADFRKLDFQRLSWQSSFLRQEVITLLSKSNKDVFLLPALFDIDTVQDVKVLVKHSQGIHLRVLSVLLSIIETDKGSLFPLTSLKGRIALQLYFNKGSPSRYSH